MRRIGTRHGYGVLVVLQAIAGFVFNFAVGGFLLHADLEAAALHHEAGNHAVKHGVGVVPLVNVAQKIGDGFRRFDGVEFEGDNAVVFDVEFYLWIAHDGVQFKN